MRDYAEQIARLRECASNNHEVHSKCGAYLSGVCAKTRDVRMNDAADAIEELLAAVPKWISVEDELPDTYEWVLVHGRESLIPAEAYFDGKTFVDGILCEIPVSHWMPLPSAPKEVE